MSLGPLMIDIAGTSLTAEERERLAHPLVGGVILFSRNFADPAQLARLVADIHGLRSPRLLVAVDQEGGRVQRFRAPFTRLPAVRALGGLYDREPEAALALAETTGWLMAAELRALDVDLSFAPVVDLDHGLSSVIGDRAFHATPAAVTRLAGAYRRGMQRAGMHAVIKHFPGHGGVRADSHLELPEDGRDFAQLRSHDLLPFRRLIENGVAALMTAHLRFPRIDPEVVSFSRHWLGDFLRGELGYQGAVFSDDLAMAGAAVAGGFADRARAALAAGCDMLPLCHHPEGVDQVLADLGEHHDPVSQARLARLHGRPAPDWDTLHASPGWRDAVARVTAFDPAPLLDMDLAPE